MVSKTLEYLKKRRLWSKIRLFDGMNLKSLMPLLFARRKEASDADVARSSVGRSVPADMRKRKKALVWTVILTIIIGVIELPLPAEDAFRAVRAELRSKAPPNNIVLVEIDDRTLRVLQTKEVSRAENAALTDYLFKAGAKKVVFDRAFADPTTVDDDRQLANALARYGERVRIGASPARDNGFQVYEGLLPNKTILPSANLASMMGDSSPFDLSVRFDTDHMIAGEVTPTISAFLAGYEGPHGVYRPDFAYDIKRIPTVSLSDILKNQIPVSEIAGKSFIVAETHITSTDFKNLPLGGRVPGAYFHIIGAHTLINGLPLDLGWMPAAFIVLVIIGIQMLRRRPSRRIFWVTFAVLFTTPLALDFFSVSLDIMPAVLGLLIGFGFLKRLARKQYGDETNLLRLSALSVQENDEAQDVFALRICNFAALKSAMAGQSTEQIIDAVTNRIGAVETSAAFAFENNTIIWLRSSLPSAELQDHALGLHALFRGPIKFGGMAHHAEVTLGSDSNTELPLQNRVQNAVQCAESAAKKGDIVKMADPTYLSDRNTQLELLEDLDDALANREISVAYQPQVKIMGGEIYGAEALIRWHHPILGNISAQKIVEMAEEHGRMISLTQHMFETALIECYALTFLNPNFKLSLNVSADSLTDRNFLPFLKSKLEETGFPAQNLVLEITETSPLDSTRTAQILADILAMNIRLSIDDFGTGHSNLDYLQRVPASEIKIDRQFVTDMDHSPEKAAVVRATIGMAHGLNRSVIAEGVETREVANALYSMGCTQAQGFLYSGALPVEKLLALMHQGRIAA